MEPETLWALAAGELGPEASARAVDHLARCPACAEDYRVTRELVSEAAADADADTADVVDFRRGRLRPRRFRPRRAVDGRPLVALAAVLTLAVGVWLQLPRGPEPPSPYRQGGAEPVIETPIRDGAVLDPGEVELRWTPIENARYDLLVTTDDLEVVAEARFLEESRYRVDPAVLASLPAGTTLVWQVEAVLPDGSRVSSDAFRIVLGAPEASP